MSRKYLTHIDLQSNELQNAVIHKLNADPTGVNGKIYYNTVSNKFRVFQDGAWKDLATGGSAASTVTLTGDVTGTGNVDPVTGIVTVNTAIDADYATDAEVATAKAEAISDANAYTDLSIGALDTDAIEEGSVNLYFTDERAQDAVAAALNAGAPHLGLTVSYDDTANALTISAAVADVVAGDGISVSSAGGTFTVANTGVVSLSGTAGEVEVTNTGTAYTVGLPNDVNIAGILTVTGDLNVEGNLNAVNRTEINIEDNTIVLNTGVTGTPTVDAGIQVERGDATNASILWNETTDQWELGLLGSETPISVEGHTHVAADVTDFNTAVDTEIDAYLTGSNSISITNGAIDTVLDATNSYLTNTTGLKVDIASVESTLIADAFTRKYAVNVGDTTNTSFAISHGLNSRDVQVQVYDNATYDTVEVDVVRTSSSVVTVSFNVAPATDAYRVVIVG